MDNIIELENELKKISLEIVKDVGNRELHLKMSKLKNDLLNAYRKEISVRIVDDSFIKGDE